MLSNIYNGAIGQWNNLFKILEYKPPSSLIHDIQKYVNFQSMFSLSLSLSLSFSLSLSLSLSLSHQTDLIFSSSLSFLSLILHMV